MAHPGDRRRQSFDRLLLTALLLGGSALHAQDRPGKPTPAASDESVLFDSPPAVETASLYTQTLQEAPANVSIITHKQIRTYGYRTLAEALSSVRGFYTSFDGDLQFIGVRGFALPGDYNTRILVMINGHVMTDNVYGAMYMFGQDFGLDMDLVDRIEIVRGPSSALYGSNGMFATVNIFTRTPADSARVRLSTEIGSFGQRKSVLSTSMYLGGGVNLLLSGSGFYAGGTTFAPAELGGARTDRVGAEQGYHTFAQLTWRHWSITANFNDRKAIVPTGWYKADFGDPGTSSRDRHDFVEVSYSRPVGASGEIQWRASYDHYRYYGRYDYTMDDGVWDNRDLAVGDWLSSRLAYTKRWGGRAALTVGGETSVDLRAVQTTEYVEPVYLLDRDRRETDRYFGVFVQQSFQVGRNWTLYAGARLDDAEFHARFVSPRLAAVWQPSSTTSYKFLYGRAFRNPSFFEQSWEPNPLLRAETMDTVEVTREQRLARGLSLTTSAFHYRVGGLIEGVPIDDMTLQYRNVSSARASGLEFEASGEPWGRFEVSAGGSFSRVRYTDPSRPLPNSPSVVLQTRAAVPLFRRKLTAAGALRYMNSRLCPQDCRVGGAAVVDLTVTTNRLTKPFDLQFGVRNLAGLRYSDPLSVEHLTQTLDQPGRGVFLKLIWRHGD